MRLKRLSFYLTILIVIAILFGCSFVSDIKTALQPENTENTIQIPTLNSVTPTRSPSATSTPVLKSNKPTTTVNKKKRSQIINSTSEGPIYLNPSSVSNKDDYIKVLGTTNIVEGSQKNISKDKLEALNNEINKVAAICKGSDFNKELTVVNYIMNRVAYENGTGDKDKYSAYGALVEGRAVCSGYAFAAKLIFDKIGIPCEVLVGTAKSGPHAWNLIKIGGKWYHLDITWCDTTSESQLLKYTYFNLSDKQISVNHVWQNIGNIPACSSTEANYYVKNGLINYNINELKQNLLEDINEGEKESEFIIADKTTFDSIIKNPGILFKNLDIKKRVIINKIEYMDNSDQAFPFYYLKTYQSY